MNKRVHIVVIIMVSLSAFNNANAQSKWLDIYKAGTKVMSIDATELDSIVFREDDDSYISIDPEPQLRSAMSFCPSLRKNQTRSTTTSDIEIEEFAVSCKKEDGTYLFNNYLCKRFPDYIGKTETNTDGWDYVFGNQSTQYWENNVTSYTFQAVAFKEGHHADVSFKNGLANISVDSNNIENVFTTDNKKLSYSNSGLVTLDFSPLASKVELYFYEEIPGYDAEITHFYNAKGETVDYPVIIGSFVNEGVAKVDWNNSQTTITPTAYVNELDLFNNNWDGKLNSNSWGSSQNTCSAFVIPSEGVDAKIQFDLRLTASTGETIDIKQEVVMLPQLYTKWESGLQYQYRINIKDPLSTDGTSLSISISTLYNRETNITL